MYRVVGSGLQQRSDLRIVDTLVHCHRAWVAGGQECPPSLNFLRCLEMHLRHLG